MLGLMPSSTSHKALPLAQHGAALLPKNMPAEAHCQEDRGINAVELVFIMTFLGYFSLFNVQIVSVVSCCGFHRLLMLPCFCFPHQICSCFSTLINVTSMRGTLLSGIILSSLTLTFSSSKLTYITVPLPWGVLTSASTFGTLFKRSS